MAENVSDGDRDIALNNEIIRVVCGSGAHGMAIPGHDDHDEMGVYIEQPQQLLGIKHSSEHYVSRTQPQGVRSGPGDIDLVLYSLRKFMRLATQGNPSIIILLYAAESDVITSSALGRDLLGSRDYIISNNAGYRFLGYLDGQRERMVGGGRQGRVPNRPELVEKYGYDTKYASHALRLGLQGIEITTTGRLSLPMRQDDLDRAMAVKTGQVDFTSALKMVDDVRSELASILSEGRSVLRPKPDMSNINNWMIRAHTRHWNLR